MYTAAGGEHMILRSFIENTKGFIFTVKFIF
jgi:hypothetical protein